MENKSNFKVLIADDDSAGSRRFIEFLSQRGFEAQYVETGEAAKQTIASWRPHFVIYDLTLQGLNAPQLLTWITQNPEFVEAKPKVIVTSGHSIVSNIKECIKLGAVDYVVRPFKFEDILTRLVFHIQKKRELLSDAKSKAKLDGGDLYLNLLDVVLREAQSQRETEDTLFNITKMLSITLKAVRCSLIQVAEDRLSGTVLVSSDDKEGKAKGIVIDMNKYPEVIHVMNTEKSVVIEDLEYDPMLAKIKDLVKGISFNSMIVLPVRRNGEIFGVVSARMDKEHSKFNERDIRFAQLVAHIIGLVLNKGSYIPHELYAILKAPPPKDEAS
ncbi:MAG: response regulator [Oligoflexia bacterium]|nr:response regulator [Oligoflexia bacterium]